MAPCPPVLFLIFNRPDLTQQVFERIRQASPRQLFIAADGPRPDIPEDEKLCLHTRQVTEQVDWDCQVQILFRERNLGCKQAMSSAINWFFEQVDCGIILVRVSDYIRWLIVEVLPFQKGSTSWQQQHSIYDPFSK